MDVERLERLLRDGNDNAALRFALGGAYLKQQRAADAVRHLSAALEIDPLYSAAWKLLGQAQTVVGDLDAAKESYARGIDVANDRGDVQAAREMQVFLRRLERHDQTREPS